MRIFPGHQELMAIHVFFCRQTSLMSDTILEKALSKVGLRPIMYWRERGRCDYDESRFISYRSSTYDDSVHLDADEVYGMREKVLLHPATGFRATYLVASNYDGNEEKFTFLNGFIITHEGQRLNVLDIEAGGFRTPEGVVSIEAVRKEYLDGDQ